MRSNAFARLLSAIALTVFALGAPPASATAQRTFVASTGSDTNTAFNCSLVKPCRGFAAAIGVTSANGEVLVLDSAGYGVIPSITQSVAINAPAGIYAGISVPAGDGVTIDGTGVVVVLRGLTINGQGGSNGITIANAAIVHVENCVIADMANKGVHVLAGTLEMKDTIVRNGTWGLFVQGPAQANLDRVRIEANATGVAAESGGHIAMQDSVVTGSSNIGVIAAFPDSTGSRVTITRSLVSANNFGLYVLPNPDGFNITQIAISDSTITENAVGVHADGASNHVGARGMIYMARSTVTANATGVEVVAFGALALDSNSIGGNKNVDLTGDAGTSVVTRNNNMALDPVFSGTLTSVPGF